MTERFTDSRTINFAKLPLVAERSTIPYQSLGAGHRF